MVDKYSAAEPVRIRLSNEQLNPLELFQARSRSHKIPVKGEKYFLPCESKQQVVHLHKALSEHWTLIGEERLEKVGNLVNAVWVPEIWLVKLLSPAGKFWQTMGFSDHGKQYLFPEEALYLMECGSIQVFYQDLPLSIQDGYEFLLSSETMNLLQYQVFGHLKRLGYVVNRFDPRLNMKLKRKPIAGFRDCKKRKHTSTEETALGRQKGYIKTSVAQYSQSEPFHPHTFFQYVPTESGTDSNRNLGRNWWTCVLSKPQPASTQSSIPCWNFSSILLPDLGFSNCSRVCLPPPDPSLLPGALQVPECDMVPWLKRLNLSTHECQRARNGQHHNINKDKEVCFCTNWVEYLDLIEKRRRQQYRDRPAYQWEKIHPLTHPGQYSSHRILMENFSIIQSSDLLERATRLPCSNEWRISFNVYQSGAEFRKSQPGKPYIRMCVCSFDGPVPDLFVMKQLSSLSRDVPVMFAVVDHGDVSFYSFKDFRLPIDNY